MPLTVSFWVSSQSQTPGGLKRAQPDSPGRITSLRPPKKSAPRGPVHGSSSTSLVSACPSSGGRTGMMNQKVEPFPGSLASPI